MNMQNQEQVIRTNRLRDFPVSLLDKLLLARVGGEGMVFRLNSKQAIKINFNGEEIYLLSKINNPQCFPKILSKGKNWYIREYFKMYTPKCKEFIEFIHQGFKSYIGIKATKVIWLDTIISREIRKGKTIEEMVSPYPKDKQWIIKWVVQAFNEYGLLWDEFMIHSNLGNLILKNIGENKQGQIIYFGNFR